MKLFAVDSKQKRTEISLVQNRKLGSGAVAEVFSLPAPFEDLAAKVYFDKNAFDREKIEAMLATSPDNVFTSINGRGYAQYAWPTHLLLDNNDRAAGYLMPSIADKDSADMEVFINPILRKRFGLEMLDAISLRLEIVRNLAALLIDLHRKGHCFIDFKPQNIRIYRDTHLVALLDCDGYSINQLNNKGKKFPATYYSSEYIAPEALINGLHPSETGIEQDNYALAVIIFQLMNNGIHPFQGVIKPGSGLEGLNTTDQKVKKWLYPCGIKEHPQISPLKTSVHFCFDNTSRLLFDRVFTGSPGSRPTAESWYNHLSSLLDKKKLVRCKRYPDNPDHIHFMGKPCMACHFKSTVTRKRSKKPPPPRPDSSEVRTEAGSPSAGSCPACGGLKKKKRGFWFWLLNGPATVLALDLVVCGRCDNLYSTSLGRVNTFILWLLRIGNIGFVAYVLLMLIVFFE